MLHLAISLVNAIDAPCVPRIPERFPLDMKISVITPTFNRAETLHYALESVLCQTLPPYEHIITDNLSKDATPEVVATYAKRAPYDVVHVREADTGVANAMNKGLARVRGEAVYILNDDDAIHDSEVFQVLCQCLAETRTDLVYGDVDWLNPETGERTHRRHNQVNKLTLVHKGMNQCAILHRAAVFQQCGPYDEGFRIAGDHEWLLRAFIKFDVSATYLRRTVAICALGGLSNSDASATRRSQERKAATERWYSPEQVRLSNTYRKFIRKLPFGTQLLDLFRPVRLRIRTVRYNGHRFVPDLAARLGF